MTELDTLLQAEKNQQHALNNPDLLAFSVLTSIAREESKHRLQARLTLGILLAITASLIVLQVIAFSGLNFDHFIALASNAVSNYPLVITGINLGLASIIFIIRRQRLI